MKFNISHKSKQFLQLSAKLLITMLALLLIARRIKGEQMVWDNWASLEGLNYAWAMLLFVGLALSNYLLQAKKWQVAVSDIQARSYGLAFKEHFRAFAISLVTPARIGEYAAKCLYFPKAHYKNVALRVLCENWSQLLATLLFGGLALALTDRPVLGVHSPGLIAGIAVLILVAMVLLWPKRRRLPIVWKLRDKEITLPPKARLLQLVGWSIIRYTVFGSQYLILLYLTDVPYSLPELAIAVALLYLITSFLPSFALTDFTVKGLVLLFLLPGAEAKHLNLLSAAFIMWLFNFALPALLGLLMLWLGRFDPKTRASWLLSKV